MQELATRGRELQPDGALPVDPATLYPEDDRFFGRRAKARRAKLLAGIEGVLRKALAPGETVRYAARGTRYVFGEYIFAGAAAQYHNMTALVLTDRRLLLVQLDARGRAADIKNHVPLDQIRGAGRTFLGWRIQLASGPALRFISMRGADRKRLQALLPAARAAAPAPAGSGTASLEHLCPACLRPVPGPVGTTLVCPAPDCRIPFRDPRKAARLSAFMPGLGDLYLRHHLFGALELLGSAAMLGIGIAFAADASVDPVPSKLLPAALLLLAVVALPRAIDHRITLHMGRKGLVPLALAPAPGAQPRNLPSFPRWSPLLFAAAVAIVGVIVVVAARDLRHDAAVRAAGELASQGRFEEAFVRWTALERSGGADEERRVRFALALLEAGDLEGMDEVRASFESTGIDAGLAKRWNAAIEEEQAALTDYSAGVQALAEGDEARAWPSLDRALAYFRRVKRPHLPASRGEVHAHLAMGALSEPLAEGDVEAASAWLDQATGAPAAEIAALAVAAASGRGDRDAALAALGKLDAGALPGGFQLLLLEARARIARDDAERAEVRRGAEALPLAGLSESEVARLEALRDLTR